MGEQILVLLKAAVFLILFVAIPLLAAAALAAAVIRSVRRKKLQFWRLLIPVLILLPYLIFGCLLTDWNYVLHHDKGFPVYNEAYLLPHYETVYQDEFTCAGKQIISDADVLYTFRSEKTGMEFEVSSYYDPFNDVFFYAHHSYADYAEVLLTRLREGESIECREGETYSLPIAEGKMFFELDSLRGGYRLSLRCAGTEEEHRGEGAISGSSFRASLKENTLVLEIPLKGGGTAEYRKELQSLLR